MIDCTAVAGSDTARQKQLHTYVIRSAYVSVVVYTVPLVLPDGWLNTTSVQCRFHALKATFCISLTGTLPHACAMWCNSERMKNDRMNKAYVPGAAEPIRRGR